MILKVLSEGFTLGLTTGTYCAISCSPFMLPYLLDMQSAYNKFKIFLHFILGRLLAYMLFALLVGFLGITIQRYLSPRVNAVVLILASLILIASSLFRTFSKRIATCKDITFCHSKMPFTIGFLLGINICPPFVAALGRVLSIGNLAYGMLFFLMFFVASTMFLLPWPFLTSFIKSEFSQKVGIYLGFLVGVWFFIQGVTRLVA